MDSFIYYFSAFVVGILISCVIISVRFSGEKNHVIPSGKKKINWEKILEYILPPASSSSLEQLINRLEATHGKLPFSIDFSEKNPDMK